MLKLNTYKHNWIINYGHYFNSLLKQIYQKYVGKIKKVGLTFEKMGIVMLFFKIEFSNFKYH